VGIANRETFPDRLNPFVFMVFSTQTTRTATFQSRTPQIFFTVFGWDCPHS
jgi:hypothetical protein